MGPVVFHPNRDWRSVALDFFRTARMVRDARGDTLPNRAPASSRRSAASFLAIWFIVIFVFFSIPRSKLGKAISCPRFLRWRSSQGTVCAVA